jgi:hypothetical protein
MYDRDKSHVGWYIGSFLIRFIELDDEDNQNPERRFIAWENVVLIKADTFDEAYEKLIKRAKSETKPYKGGAEGVDVKWELVGITDLVPIYEELEDGAEILRNKFNRKLKTLEKWFHTKEELKSQRGDFTKII